MPAVYLTTTALDCSAMSYTELRFRRRLGVQGRNFDRATLEVSADGSSWTTIWENGPSALEETFWSLKVYLRWGMGPTNYSVTYPGWNIDDVEIWSNVVVVPSDFDGNGLVNLDDMGNLHGCLSGPQGGLGPGCLCVDLDADDDVDLADFAAFQEALGD